MKKKILILTICSLQIGQLAAQEVVGGAPGKGLDMQAYPSGFITQLPMAPPEVKGDVYLISEWTLADIVLFNQGTELKECSIKINLQTNDLEINYQNQVKVLAGARVQNFSLKSNTGIVDEFVNAKKYKLNNTPLSGFLKVIDSGRWELLSLTRLKLIKAAYVAALDAGEKSDRLVKEEVFFFAKDHSVYETALSQKKFCRQFNEKEALVEKFIDEQDISLKKVDDLITLLRFLNENI